MKARYKILAIVEGHGEVTAVPLLLRRWFAHRGYKNFETLDLAIRASGSGALKCAHEADEDLGVESYVAIAAAEKPDGILIVLDADDDCPKDLGQSLRGRARATAPHIPIEVVVANREYEAWFLAGLASLRRAGKIPPGARLARPLESIESIRNCKKPLRELLGRPYEETTDQADFTGALPFTQSMERRSRSYFWLTRKLDALVSAARSSRRKQ